MHRDMKREEAAERQANVEHDRTKAHRFGHCECEEST
jgi:hypothetical protein